MSRVIRAYSPSRTPNYCVYAVFVCVCVCVCVRARDPSLHTCAGRAISARNYGRHAIVPIPAICEHEFRKNLRILHGKRATLERGSYRAFLWTQAMEEAEKEVTKPVEAKPAAAAPAPAAAEEEAKPAKKKIDLTDE